MRFNPHETTGSRDTAALQRRTAYEVAAPSEFLLNVHAAQTPRQTRDRGIFRGHAVSAGRSTPIPPPAIASPRSTPTRAVVDVRYTQRWWRSPIGSSIRPTSWRESPAALPVDTLRFLYPSRYCQADLVQQRAWDRFGTMPRGYAQVRRRARLGARELTFRSARRTAARRCSTRCARAQAYAAISRTP